MKKHQIFLVMWVIIIFVGCSTEPTEESTYIKHANELGTLTRTEAETPEQKIIRETQEKVLQTKILTLSEKDAFVPPKLLRMVAPKYPAAAAKAHMSGTVNVAVVIDVMGHVVNAKVISSSWPIFDESALEAIKQWTFSPAEKDGKAVNLLINVPVVFEPR